MTALLSLPVRFKSSLLVFSILIAGAVNLFCSATGSAQEELSAARVRNAIKAGADFLLRRQTNGKWQRFEKYDVTPLTTLALLNAGVSPRDARMVNALRELESLQIGEMTTYTVSLRIMALAAADPTGKRYRKRIRTDVNFLLRMQTKDGPKGTNGGWHYGRQSVGFPDASNTQFAILALHEASLVGVEIPQENWKACREFWDACFEPRTGGFAYAARASSVKGSLTCAGISSLIIIEENLKDSQSGTLCCLPPEKDDKVRRALAWMARNFRVNGNPHGNNVGDNVGDQRNHYYYLYAMERAGRLSGQRFFTTEEGKQHDWYRTGAETLLRLQSNGSWRGNGNQGERNPDIATSLALLFLAKGKRPIVIGKLQHGTGENWDLHPKGIHRLTRRLESEWTRVQSPGTPQQKLTWQTILSANASVEDFLEAPVLHLSGKDAALLTKSAKQNLKKYIENGGFVFAEACQGEGCPNQVGFDRAFRNLMKELFPENKLELIPPDHPIWNSHHQIEPQVKDRPLLGLQACCRTSVVYCPRNLSCFWQMNAESPEAKRARLEKKIKYCNELGVNVVTYATGRQLRDKGDGPKLSDKAISVLEDRELVLPKLKHRGGQDEAPNAWRNALNQIRPLGVRIKTEKKLISPNIDELADHPFVFMHGRQSINFTSDERSALKLFLESGHGFLLVDSICSSESFTKSFRKEIKNITGKDLEAIPPNHPIWQSELPFTHDIRQVTLRSVDPKVQGGFREKKTPPLMEGISVNGRLVVVFSPFDLSCALENSRFSQCKGYTRQDAEKMILNILQYRLQSD